MSFFTDLITEKDGISYCPARVGMLIGLIVFIILSAYAVFSGQHFEAQNWGIGYGTLLGGGGAGIWAKGKSE